MSVSSLWGQKRQYVNIYNIILKTVFEIGTFFVGVNLTISIKGIINYTLENFKYKEYCLKKLF